MKKFIALLGAVGVRVADRQPGEACVYIFILFILRRLCTDLEDLSWNR